MARDGPCDTPCDRGGEESHSVASLSPGVAFCRTKSPPEGRRNATNPRKNEVCDSATPRLCRKVSHSVAGERTKVAGECHQSKQGGSAGGAPLRCVLSTERKATLGKRLWRCALSLNCRGKIGDRKSVSKLPSAYCPPPTFRPPPAPCPLHLPIGAIFPDSPVGGDVRATVF